MNKHDLVIGQAAGYTYQQVEPFLRSLKRAGFVGHIVWFVLESDQKLQHSLERQGVFVVPYKKHYPYFSNSLYQNELPLEDDGRSWHPATLRFFLYEAWLKRHGSAYQRVLHADTRDVIFQNNPFSEHWPDGVHVFLEHPQLRIGNEPSNRAWILNCFGKEALEKIKDKPIACSGVILGTNPEWMDFLNSYNQTMINCGFTGHSVDQGTLNYLVYKDAIDKPAMQMAWPDDTWLVSTESYYKPTRSINWNTKLKVVNTRNKVISIVHQYDRNALLSLIWNQHCWLQLILKNPRMTTRSLIANISWWITSSTKS